MAASDLAMTRASLWAGTIMVKAQALGGRR